MSPKFFLREPSGLDMLRNDKKLPAGSVIDAHTQFHRYQPSRIDLLLDRGALLRVEIVRL